MPNPFPVPFLTEIRSPETGKLDARLIAQTFGFTLRELGEVVRRDPRGLSKHPTSDALQPLLLPLEGLALQLREVVGSLEMARMWLRAPNPVLSGEAPMTYLLRGDGATITKVLRMAETGMPT